MTPLLSFLIALTVNAAFFAIVLPFAGGHEPVQLTASLLVLIWAARLGGYLFRRILQMEVDHRFDDMRDKPLRFGRFWLLQATLCAPLGVRRLDGNLAAANEITAAG